MNEGGHSTNSKSAPNVIRLAVVMCIGVMCYVICSSLDVFFVPFVKLCNVRFLCKAAFNDFHSIDHPGLSR